MTHTGDETRRLATRGQVVVLGLLSAGIAMLAKWHEGPVFWCGALLGIAGIGGYFVQFDTPRGAGQWLLAAVGFCMVFMFGLQLLIGVFS
ncbi:hypothetical protein HYE82_16470 [Streptomyces sp. BR123]|jgi:hypothetical protein|uniref:hypothetical protein n=1 Tax=Streptomyces sp. BR123 TaxID=2749828 RepID=UPI0015C44C00|nr:hypothetical protein [Streptomyces sp. BR123]NXY95955.1 hypothetical protein [Streptomyces sp. BR123]